MFPFIPQHDQMDCGPACLAMVSIYHGQKFGIQFLRDNCFLSREGVSLLGISEAAQKVGFKTIATKLTVDKIQQDLLPCILHWKQNHFVVLHGISTNSWTGKKTFKIADPAHGRIQLSEEKFLESWTADGETGIGLFLAPLPEFYSQNPPEENLVSLSYLIKYLKPHKREMFWLLFLTALGTGTTMAFPILTQKLIDNGVSKKDMGIISYILLAQLVFFMGNMVFAVFRNWITLKVGTKVNIDIISDFLKKLLKLPIRFFDTKLMGDFNQRIQDHERIEQFLTSQSLLTVFSILTFSVFFVVLCYYDTTILLFYLLLTTASLVWFLFWLKRRKVLDYYRFQQRSENQESIYEIINGVTELKLNQFEDYKRTEWEKIQQRLFTINLRILKIDQLQVSGFEFINQFKNIFVTFLSATLVVKGEMSLGQLLAISYILGQLNSPLNQLTAFFRSLQDAKLSLERLNEVQNHLGEEEIGIQGELGEINSWQGINLRDVSFQYEGPKSAYILKDININIPSGKVTAIVGASGSGKTTLMKLLLKFYEPVQGSIRYGADDILDLSPVNLRINCGVVMQDGYIFSDTIARNIATGDEKIDMVKLWNAIEMANIKPFVDELPLGINTKIGAAGNGISGGQKQRILIARAIYKNPRFIFLDEATSALDAENENIIHNNLNAFFKGKTVVVIAHRLSTVKNADQIIVLKHGEVAETGEHDELVGLRKNYFELVRNQLELGN